MLRHTFVTTLRRLTATAKPAHRSTHLQMRTILCGG
jgi:hypothetical protein